MKNLKWILVAEDDEPIAELTILALGAEGLDCEIVLVRDGSAALDCIYRRKEYMGRAAGDPIFILLDLKMPRVDGIEVLREIKSNEQFKNIPVVMFTSSREMADITRCYQLGANAYVVKPIIFQDFNEALRSVGHFWAAINEIPGQKSAHTPPHLAPA